MDIRRLRHIQNHLPARVPSRRSWRKSSRLSAETPSLNALLAWLETGRSVYQVPSFTSRTMAGAFACGGILTLAGIAGMIVWETWAYKFGAVGVFGVGLLLCAGCLPVALRFRADAERSRALLQLTGYDDLRAIAPLTEALFARDRRLRDASRIALTRLLPRLQAADGSLLPPRQRAMLKRCLTRRNARQNPELACAVQQCLEQIGDRHTLEAVIAPAYTRKEITQESNSDT